MYGQVLEVDNSSSGQPITKFIYNEKGLRAAKQSYNTSGALQTQLNYLYDAAGSLVCTYETDFNISRNSHVTYLKDYIVYGASRLGLYDAANSSSSNRIYYYEMNDHLGNVRAVFSKNSNGTANVVSFTDYYPHGSPLPGRNYVSSLGYRYDYQGQEKDAETGLLNFELRQFDPRLGRWFAPDPMGQYHSPYLAMGNNPVSMVDPTGGFCQTQEPTSHNPNNPYNGYMDAGYSSALSMYTSNYGGWTPSGEVMQGHDDNVENRAIGMSTNMGNQYTPGYDKQVITSQPSYGPPMYGTVHVPGSGNPGGGEMPDFQSLNAGFLGGGLKTGYYFVFEDYTPTIYRNTSNDLASHPQWNTLTYNGRYSPQTTFNRSLMDLQKPVSPDKKVSRDEFPMASTQEGGYGAQVHYVPRRENWIQGKVLQMAYFGLNAGDKIRVILVPKGMKDSPLYKPYPVGVPNVREKPNIPFFPLIMRGVQIFSPKFVAPIIIFPALMDDGVDKYNRPQQQ